MDLDSLLASERRILSDGSLYELLRRSSEVEFDQAIAHAGLIYDPQSKSVLERVLRTYIEVGVSRGLPMALATTTWRANRDRVAASNFADRPVNQDNAAFLLAVRDEYASTGVPLSVGGTYELTFEVNRSSNEALFGESHGPSLLGHLNGFWQLTEAVDLDLGVSAMFGDHDVEDALSWAPPGRSRYRGVVLRGGVMVRDPGDVPEELDARGATGAWVNGEARLSQRWLVGARYGWVEDPGDPGESVWLVAPTLTWWHSEWVRIRAEYDVIDRPDGTDGLFVAQATVSLGPHKHETY